MNPAICTVPIAPVRSEAAHRSEMTNQLHFGELLEVLEEKEEWLRVRSTFDGYEGWVTVHLVSMLPAQLPQASYYTTDLLSTARFREQDIHVPAGTMLTGFDPATGKLWHPDYSFHGAFRHAQDGPDFLLLKKQASRWLNAPYLWGGKTVLGVDCSGFVQTLFKPHGIRLLRDAYQQAEQGVAVDRVADTTPGDLAFFQNEKGRVTHVGMVYGTGQIIHAAGKVRIDTLTDEGILVEETGRRTHNLHSLRRIL